MLHSHVCCMTVLWQVLTALNMAAFVSGAAVLSLFVGRQQYSSAAIEAEKLDV